ncbi:MAG: hypothetical protein AAF962_25370 [Actinomycetota bacterium]
MVDVEHERQMLSMVLDGLDDLYDQRFGAPVGAIRDTRAEVWLLRLLIAVSAAFGESPWASKLREAADEIRALMHEGLAGHQLNDGALAATDDLRSAIASQM